MCRERASLSNLRLPARHHLLGTALSCSLAGPVIQKLFGHDTVGILDGAWKVFCGYRPHVDFYNFVGDFDFILFAAVMKFIGPTANALPIGNAVFACAVGAAAWMGARRRLSAPLLFLFTLFVGFVVFSAHLLRFSFNATTYATIYNRHGYALVSVTAICLFLAPRNGRSRRELLEGFIVGVLIGLLLLIKITYFMAAGFLAASALLLQPSARRLLPALLLGALLIIIPFFWYLGFNVSAFIQDLGIAASARSGVISLTASFLHVAANNNHLALLLLMWLLATSLQRSAGSSNPVETGPSKNLAALVAVSGCAVFIVATNAAFGSITEVPLLTAMAFIFMEHSGRTLPARSGSAGSGSYQSLSGSHFAVCALGLLLVGEVFLRDLASVAYGVTTSVARAKGFGSANRFQTRSMSDLVFLGHAGDWPTYEANYAERINDGLVLLQQTAAADSRVATFDFTNPFPFALLRPPQAGPIFWHLDFEFNRTVHPSAERYLGDAGVVMIPKFSGEPGTTAALLEVYGEYLDRHFKLVAESRFWRLLQRLPEAASNGRLIKTARPDLALPVGPAANSRISDI